MRNIGIVTQPLSGNYGGLLQNYALQQSLRELGYSSVTLNMASKFPFSRYWRITLKSLFMSLTGHPRPMHKRTVHSYKGRSTEQFVEQYLNVTPLIFNYSPSLVRTYSLDVVVVGSDQVWRPKYNDHLEDMFLRFVASPSVKKVAYSASFGVDKWEFDSIQTARCSRLAKKIHAISVREDSGVHLCKDCLGVDAIRTLDPTMLLTKDDYFEICENEVCSKEKFVGAYFIDMNDRKKSILSQVSRSLGITEKSIIGVSQNYSSATVNEWLAMFRDADFIVTDSFHGTVFSILFHKPFITVSNQERGESRYSSLFSTLGISSRLYTESVDELLQGSIDWDIVETALERERKQSFNFLRDNLSSGV